MGLVDQGGDGAMAEEGVAWLREKPGGGAWVTDE